MVVNVNYRIRYSLFLNNLPKFISFFADIFFESFKSGLEKFLDKITAAAVTGPARQPLPASSVPASIFFDYCVGSNFI